MTYAYKNVLCLCQNAMAQLLCVKRNSKEQTHFKACQIN